MQIISEIVVVPTPSQFATDVGVTLFEGKFYMALHLPVSGQNQIAIRSGDDGITFTEPRVILRPDPQIVGATRGAETPSAPLPPVPGFPYWSLIAMTYDLVPNRAQEHYSVGTMAYATDPLGYWQWADIALAPTTRRQQVTSDSGKLEGGLSEFSVLHVGDGLIACLYATNSYRPKPAIFVAYSPPPVTMRSFAPRHKPVIEGEDELWASQPHMFKFGQQVACVYVEGPPERVRVARANATLDEWTPGEILLTPSQVSPTTERCVGPCLVPLNGTQGRLYFTAVSEHNQRWQTMTALVSLES